jgi:ER lumen protein retaining receptor
LTLIIHTQFSPWEMTWSFSLWLESVAIMPQINILSKFGGADSFILHYIACLGSYRFFYILWWAYRYSVEGFVCWTSVLAGLLQVALYIDFFVLYVKNYKQIIKLDLPLTNSDSDTKPIIN